MSDLKIKLKKPYTFEDQKEIREIDLSGLEEMTAQDLMRAEKLSATVNGADFTPVKEMTLGYCLALASVACKQPIEFMMGLPGPVAIAVKNNVTSFLYSSEYVEETVEDLES